MRTILKVAIDWINRRIVYGLQEVFQNVKKDDRFIMIAATQAAITGGQGNLGQK